MSDPNIYQGPAGGGIHHALVNAAAGGPGQADNTGGTDAGPTFAAQLAAGSAGSGQIVWTPKGLYTVNTPIAFTEGLWRGGPGATINSTIPYVDSFVDCLFTDVHYGVKLTTLATAAVEGASVFNPVTTAPLVIGQFIQLYVADGSCGLTYQMVGIGAIGSTDVTAAGLYGGGGALNGETLILNVNGAGPVTLNLSGAGNTATRAAFLAALQATWPALTIVQVGGPVGITGGVGLVLTAATSLVVGAGSANGNLGLTAGVTNAIQVDRPIAFNFPIGTHVPPVTPADFRMDFDGGTLSGIGGRTLHCVAAIDSVFENAFITSGWTTFGPDYDLGSLRSTFRGLVVYVPPTSPGLASATSIAIETGENSRIEDCSTYNGFQGYQFNGKSSRGLHLSAANHIGTGIRLEPAEVSDLWASRFGSVLGSNFDACGSAGLQIAGNSYGNAIVGVACAYNGTGFSCQTGATTAVTTGVSENVFAACVAYGGALGFTIGDGAHACDGNRFLGCTAALQSGYGFSAFTSSTGSTFVGCNAVSTGAAGFRAEGNVPDTRFVGCVAKSTTSYGFYVDGIGTLCSGCAALAGSTDAYYIDGGSTKTQLDGCSSTGNAGIGINILADAFITNYQSANDAVSAIATVDNGNAYSVYVQNAQLTTTVGWSGLVSCAIPIEGTGNKVRISNVRIIGHANAGTGIAIGFNLSTAEVWLDNVTVTGTSFGVYLASGTLHFGAGCVLDGVANSFATVGGTVTMAQTGGVATFPGGVGATTMKFAQHYCNSIEVGTTSPIAAGAQVITPLASFIGQQFVVKNSNTGASTTTVFGFIVPVGTTVLLRCNSAGVWEHDVLT